LNELTDIDCRLITMTAETRIGEMWGWDMIQSKDAC